MTYKEALQELLKIYIEKKEKYFKAEKRLSDEIGDVAVFFDKIFIDKLEKAKKEMLEALNEIYKLVAYMNKNEIKMEDLYKAD